MQGSFVDQIKGIISIFILSLYILFQYGRLYCATLKASKILKRQLNRLFWRLVSSV